MPQDLPPFRLERYLARSEFTAPHVLCASDCETIEIGELLALEEGAADAFARLRLGYTESAGDPALRDAIARGYETIGAEEVLVHGAGQEAIFTFMHALLEPGDHVIVHYPTYQSLHEVPRSLGCRVTLWEARFEDGWAPSLEALDAAIEESTRLVVVNTPHSPTGYHMDRDTWRSLIDIVSAAGAWLLSDEAYRGLEADDAHRLPAACDAYERACSLALLSKGYGLAGLRVGWLATHDAALRNRIQEIKDYTTICSSAPSEFLARIALERGDVLLEASRARIAANTARFDAFFEVHAERFAWVRPRAGSVGFPRLLDGDADAFCSDVLEAAGVLLLPGSVFDPGSRHFRVGLGRDGVESGLAALDRYLTANA